MVVGKWKDEMAGLILKEFIGLRSKCYSILYRGKVITTMSTAEIHCCCNRFVNNNFVFFYKKCFIEKQILFCFAIEEIKKCFCLKCFSPGEQK